MVELIELTVEGIMDPVTDGGIGHMLRDGGCQHGHQDFHLLEGEAVVHGVFEPLGGLDESVMQRGESAQPGECPCPVSGSDEPAERLQMGLRAFPVPRREGRLERLACAQSLTSVRRGAITE